MHLDTWILIAAWQLLLASWVGAGYLWWRGRAARAEVAKMAEQCTAAEAALEAGKKALANEKSKNAWQDHLRERVKTLKAMLPAADSPEAHTNAAHVAVLEHEIGGGTGQLLLNVGAAPGAPDDAPVAQNAAEIDALRKENEALKSSIADVGRVHAQSTSDRERELKGLVQQFTHDSREMLGCIQKLEAENTDLRQQLRQLSKDAA
jgi:hypothetical protein